MEQDHGISCRFLVANLRGDNQQHDLRLEGALVLAALEEFETKALGVAGKEQYEPLVVLAVLAQALSGPLSWKNLIDRNVVGFLIMCLSSHAQRVRAAASVLLDRLFPTLEVGS